MGFGNENQAFYKCAGAMQTIAPGIVVSHRRSKGIAYCQAGRCPLGLLWSTGRFIAMALLLGPSVDARSNFVVNSTLDIVDAAPGDGVCATSGGVCTLRAAIQQARAVLGAHVITLPAGTYTFTIAGRGESNGATGDLNLGLSGRDITINGAGAASTIIDANGIDRVFQSIGGNLTLNDLTVRNGNSNDFGGCFRFTGANLTLSRTVVKSCNAGLAGGGGIDVSLPSTVTLTDTTITQNVSPGDGGGIYLSHGTTAMITRTTISGNSARYGAGIFFLSGASPSTLTLANTTISGNTATSWGGATYFSSETGSSVTLANVTIASNSSGGGGGAVVVSGTGSLQVRNTIIANSVGSSAANCFLTSGGVVTDLGNNLEFPGTVCGFALASDVRANPLLGSLTNNGGSTETHALGQGSPAIDAGDDASCVAAPVSGVDQRGRSRPKGVRCDMGAFELPAAFTDPTLAPGVTPIKVVHITDLRTRINAVRAARNLSAYEWTDPTLTAGSTVVKAVHVLEMRTALAEAYTQAGMTPPTYTIPIPALGVTVMATAISELRVAVSSIE